MRSSCRGSPIRCSALRSASCSASMPRSCSPRWASSSVARRRPGCVDGAQVDLERRLGADRRRLAAGRHAGRRPTCWSIGIAWWTRSTAGCRRPQVETGSAATLARDAQTRPSPACSGQASSRLDPRLVLRHRPCGARLNFGLLIGIGAGILSFIPYVGTTIGSVSRSASPSCSSGPTGTGSAR